MHSRLARRFTVIAPDLLGHGQSDKPRADYSVAAYANGMRDLLSVLDIDQVTVVGHSLGGGVAMQFAYQFPQMVERLILVGAGGVTRTSTSHCAWRRFPVVVPQSASPAAGAARPSTGRRAARNGDRIDWRPDAISTHCVSWPDLPGAHRFSRFQRDTARRR